MGRKLLSALAVVAALLLTPQPAAAATITFTSAAPTSPVTAGHPFSHTFTATGDTTINYSVFSGGLPVGTWLSSAGLFSGTPVSVGTYNFTIRATGSPSGASADQAVSIVVAPPTINVAPVPATPIYKGQHFSHTFTASGGAAPYTYSLVSGALPIGASLSSPGVLSGTPAIAGTYSFVLRATDLNGYHGDRTVSLEVKVPHAAFTSGPPPGGTVGTVYSHQFAAASDSGITVGVSGGALPAGLALTSAGVLSGTPPAAGSYSFVVKATGAGSSATQEVTLVIAAAPAGPSLPVTGPATLTILSFALLLVVAGAGLFLYSRKRSGVWGWKG